MPGVDFDQVRGCMARAMMELWAEFVGMAGNLLALLGRLLEQGGSMLCMWHVFGQFCMWTQECQHLSSRAAGMACSFLASQQRRNILQFVCETAVLPQQLYIQHSTNQADDCATASSQLLSQQQHK